MEKLSLASLFSYLIQPGPAAAWIDVRSELEFEKAALPGTINIPLLLQAERHEIGIAYKNEGQEAAIALGEKLVGPHQAARIEAWSRAISQSPARRGIIMCWRGGLRSQIVTEWLRDAGLDVQQLEGGYKAVRNGLRTYVEQAPELIVLQGLTGSGKTELLRSLSLPQIDLEAAAHHRGSAFGSWLDQPQPAQTTFENDIAMQILLKSHQPAPRLIEDESRLLGVRCVPEALLAKMRLAPVIRVEDSMEARTRRIYREYIGDSLSQGPERARLRQHALASFACIERRLDIHAGRIREKMIAAFRSDGDEDLHRDWIGDLLENYYDKRYHHAAARHQRRVLFTGDSEACRAWLLEKGDALRCDA